MIADNENGRCVAVVAKTNSNSGRLLGWIMDLPLRSVRECYHA